MKYICMAAVLTLMRFLQAAFALENLGCTGAENRLVDCNPQAAGGAGPGCTPFSDNYAFVACGMTTGPGAPMLLAAALPSPHSLSPLALSSFPSASFPLYIPWQCPNKP